ALKKPTALGGPWKVYGTARRSKPSWFPSTFVDHYISFDASNLDDTIKNLSPISNEVTHVFWVAIQVRENEEANVSINSAMLKNVLDVLKSVYANICKNQGLPFRFPGNRYTWEHFCDASDARVLAEQHIWAAVSEKAKNQAFNCTNGDVFTWKSFWKELSKVFNVQFVQFDGKEKFDVVEIMKKNASVWDQIVEDNGLFRTKIEDMITSFDALKTVLNFEFQHVSSMTKSRDFGFFGYADTLRSIEMWVRRLQEMKIIP
ncbi:hypothetical protein QQP08_020551, partial [Theobroma cacao]